MAYVEFLAGSRGRGHAQDFWSHMVRWKSGEGHPWLCCRLDHYTKLIISNTSSELVKRGPLLPLLVTFKEILAMKDLVTAWHLTC